MSQPRPPSKYKLFIRKMIYTPDDWYPNCEDDRVRGSVVFLHNGDLRICFWGNDDFGLELDLPDGTVEEAEWWSRWLSNLAIVTQSSLRSLGFYNA